MRSSNDTLSHAHSHKIKLIEIYSTGEHARNGKWPKRKTPNGDFSYLGARHLGKEDGKGIWGNPTEKRSTTRHLGGGGIWEEICT